MGILSSPIFLIVPYIVFSIFLGFLGKDKRIGNLKASIILFLISMTLTPLVGLIFLSFAKTPDPFEDEIKEMQKLFKCEYCGWKFEQEFKNCPHCGRAMNNEQ